MSKLYLDCSMGASGDMFCGALIGLSSDYNSTISELTDIGFNGVKLSYSPNNEAKNGGSFSVIIDGKEEGEESCHSHGTNAEKIFNHIDKLNISDSVRTNARAVYNKILLAESIAHDMPVDKVHLHEVGNTDAICDIVCACYLMDKLDISEVYSSAVNTGSGTVMTAHGQLDVPAPATKLLLEGCEIYKGEIQSELCTPTGAALIKHFVKEFLEAPNFEIINSSAGFGKKKFDKPNCLICYLGE